MAKYVKVTFSNDYCGCDEEEYYEYEDTMSDRNIDQNLYEEMTQNYSFYEPSSSLVEECDDEEKYQEEIEAYQAGCSYDWHYISEEEYNEVIK